MFVRIKKIQGKFYAYSVQNRRVRGKIKQKVKAYIGKAFFPKKTKDIDFFSFVNHPKDSYTETKTIKEIVEDLAKWELFKHDLKDIKIDINKFSLTKENKPIIIKLNEGYLYSKTIKDIIDFHVVGDDEYFIGKEFAETFIKAGIDIPKELFVKLFEKIVKN